MSNIEINILNSFYKNKKGIKNINLKIESGDFIALLGNNGAGKTTLLNTLVGIKDFEGKINIDYKYNQIAYVSQKQVIDWYLSVRDNIRMEEIFLDKKDENLFNNIVKMLDLDDKLDYFVEELSGGQLQRVQIARAFLKNPKLYILDEPTTGLDIYSSENVMKYLKEEVENNKTVIVSSHNLELIEKFCRKIIYISNGEIIFYGFMQDFIKNGTLREKMLKELANE